jgi:putative Ca2+/H+ antiporter (TMEM165/GDT1 family)
MAALPIISTFLLILVAELGDKTQLITITLAAETSPIIVLLGMTMAFALLITVAMVMGAKVLSRLPLKWLKIGTSALFIIIGTFTILSAVLEISII